MLRGPARLLLALGVEPRVLMELLGHSAIAVTMNTCTHVMPALKRDATTRMQQAFGRLTLPSPLPSTGLGQQGREEEPQVRRVGRVGLEPTTQGL